MIMRFLKKFTNYSIYQLAAMVLVGFLLLDLVSFGAGYFSIIGSIFTLLIVIAWLFLAIKKLSIAVIFLIAELVIGSFGRIISFDFGSIEISLRLMLFIAAFGVMLYKIASNREHIIFRHKWRWWFAGAIAAVLATAARGYYNWNSPADLILDVNGYLYILLLPLFLEAYEEVGQDKIIRYVQIILVPAIIWLSVRTLILLYTFTHFNANQLINIYKWYRDSGLGEITPAGSGFFRIFSQSHLYSSLASVIGFAWVWLRLKQNKTVLWKEPMIVFTVLALAALVASLSRSLWLGVAIAWLLIPVFANGPKKIITSLWYLLTSIVLVASASGAVLVIAKLNWPIPPLGSGSAQVFINRFGAEPASQARLNLLSPLLKTIEDDPVVGRGFGSTITYFSTDPRLVQSTAGGTGLVTTYAFEWGYLDFWYKFGIVGLAFFSAWFLYPWIVGIKKWHQGKVVGAAALALTALLVTHLTTPYLNHPLGLGAVIALGTFILARENT